jgi:hypothetical protein
MPFRLDNMKQEIIKYNQKIHREQMNISTDSVILVRVEESNDE